MTQMFRHRASWLSLSAFLFDLLAVVGAWLVSYLLRFNGVLPAEFLMGGLRCSAGCCPCTR